MHFVTGEVVEIYEENGLQMGKVRLGGALTRVALHLLPDVQVGDVVLTHVGVALSKIQPDNAVDRTQSNAPEV